MAELMRKNRGDNRSFSPDGPNETVFITEQLHSIGEQNDLSTE